MQQETNIIYVGYARVSTEDQNLDLQLNALRDYGRTSISFVNIALVKP